MKCPACGATADPGEKFCSGCGAPLASAAPTSPVIPTDSNFFTAAIIVALGGCFCFPLGQIYGLMKMREGKRFFETTGTYPRAWNFLVAAMIVSTIVGIAQAVLSIVLFPEMFRLTMKITQKYFPLPLY